MRMLTTEQMIRKALPFARCAAAMSPDPSTKVGAAVVDHEGNVVGCDCNRFPTNLPIRPGDLENRERKLQRMVHAEVNALRIAGSQGYLLVSTAVPCAACALAIASHSTILEVAYSPEPDYERRWLDNILVGLEILRDTGVRVHTIGSDLALVLGEPR